MRPFVFRWQRMLRLVEGFEKDRRNMLAIAIGELTRAEDELARQRSRLAELKEKRFELVSGGVDIIDVQENYLGEVEMDVRIARQVKLIEQCEEVVEKRREELTEKMRERKTYEKLRERALDEHNTEMKREEMRTVDEVASIAFGRAEADEDG